jgi:hypothetical protein
MAWLAVDKNGDEMTYMDYPERNISKGMFGTGEAQYVFLPSGSIEKLIGRKLTWSDEPVELLPE